MRLDKLSISFCVLSSASLSLGQHATLRATSVSHSMQFFQGKAWELLTRTMEQDRFTPCKGVIYQRESLNSDSVLQLWAEQSSDGRLKLTVLSPLSKQGVTNIDDGRQWMTYLPDENKVILQPSPRQDVQSPRDRLKIAQKNYSLAVKSGDHQVAGRSVYCVTATSRFPEMPARRYCIDKKKPFLLRMEVLTNSGAKVMLDTKEVEYPNYVPAEDFDLEPRDRTKLFTFNAPARMPLGRNAKNIVGFKPLVPSSLPFGFEVEQPQLGGSPKKRFVAVRITDGLVNATVYEWNKAKDVKRFGKEQSADRQHKNVGFRLVGEVPEAVMVKLLDAFMREAIKNLEPLSVEDLTPETLDVIKALNSAKVEVGTDVPEQGAVYALIEIED
jgi:hypothetical protein